MDKKAIIEILKDMIDELDADTSIKEGKMTLEEYVDRRNALAYAINALDNQPQWIPIQTRDVDSNLIWEYIGELPKNNQEVLITTKDGIALTRYYVDDGGQCFEGYEDRDDVLAWMPLPKTYTEEDSENEDS